MNLVKRKLANIKLENGMWQIENSKLDCSKENICKAKIWTKVRLHWMYKNLNRLLQMYK